MSLYLVFLYFFRILIKYYSELNIIFFVEEKNIHAFFNMSYAKIKYIGNILIINIF